MHVLSTPFRAEIAPAKSDVFVRVHTFGSEAVLAITDEINIASDPAFEREFEHFLLLYRGRNVRAWAGAESLSSSRIETLIDGAKQATSHRVSSTRQNLRPIDRRLFSSFALGRGDPSPLPSPQISAGAPRTVPSTWERPGWRRPLSDPRSAGWTTTL
jgi:hypothetical protein